MDPNDPRSQKTKAKLKTKFKNLCKGCGLKQIGKHDECKEKVCSDCCEDLKCQSHGWCYFTYKQRYKDGILNDFDIEHQMEQKEERIWQDFERDPKNEWYINREEGSIGICSCDDDDDQFSIFAEVIHSDLQDDKIYDENSEQYIQENFYRKTRGWEIVGYWEPFIALIVNDGDLKKSVDYLASRESRCKDCDRIVRDPRAFYLTWDQIQSDDIERIKRKKRDELIKKVNNNKVDASLLTKIPNFVCTEEW